MAQSAIGRAALVLSVNADRLESGLARVAKLIQTSAKRWAATARGAGEAVGEAVSVGIKAGLAGVAGLGLTVAAPFIAATKIAKDQLDELQKRATAGASFGLDAQTSTGLFGLFGSVGSDVRDAVEGMATLSGRASENGEVAANLFRGLNLEAAKFGQLRSDEQMYALFDALSAVANPADRVRLLMAAIGEDTGKNFLPLLGKTGAEIRQLATGFSATAEEMAKVSAAQAAFTNLNNVIERLKTKLAVASAPFLEAIAKTLSNINVDAVGSALTTMYDRATNVWESLSKYVAGVIDDWSKRAANFFSADRIEGYKNSVISAFTDMGKAAVNLVKAIEGVSDAWKVAEGWFSKNISSTAIDWFASANKWAGGRDKDNDWDKELKRASKLLRKEGGKKVSDGLAGLFDTATTPTPQQTGIRDLFAGIANAITGRTPPPPTPAPLPAPAFKPPEAKPGKYETNTALLAGSREELSARLKAMGGGNTIANAQLAEAKRQTTQAERHHAELLKAVAGGVAGPALGVF